MNFGNNTFIRSASPQFSDEEDLSAETTVQEGVGTSALASHPPKTEFHYPRPEMEGNIKRGRNTFAFWVLMLLLFVLTVGNLALTLTIIGVLRFGHGMQYMELVPEAETIKFYGDVDLDRILKKDGVLEGFADVPMSISGDAGSVLINLVYRNGHAQNKLIMAKNGTHFRNVNQFDIRHPSTRETVFSTTKPRYNIPEGGRNLRAEAISASRITSPIKENLQVQAGKKGKLSLSGAEGITFDGQEILWSADQNIQLKSINGSIVLSAAQTYLDIGRIPIVQMENGLRTGPIQYKICVCMPGGKLFRVPIMRGHASKASCIHFNSHFNPCQ